MGRRNLRRELARLRTAGAAEALHTDGDRLSLAPAVAVDARSFEQALQDGDADAALAHWGGPPADGLALGDADAFDDWLGGERVRLLDLRRQALETAASAAETRSDHGAAMGLLQQLLGDDPLQESHHRSLMRLLAAAGHREAALAQYQRCTELLRTELGLAPMAETVALAAALRGADPAVDRASSGAPQPVLPERLPFVGRHAEVAALEAAWHAGSAVLIEGDAGVGKSRLALDFAAAHGTCAVARCRPGDDELAFAAFARALRAMADPGSGAFDALAPWARGELARLLPELGPTLPPIGSAEERSRFFEACALAWQALPADDFDVLVLDDWHLADADSRALLTHVAQRRREDRAAGVREWILLRPELAPEARQRLQDGLQATAIRAATAGRARRARPGAPAVGVPPPGAVRQPAAAGHRRQPLLPDRDAAPPGRNAAAVGG